MTSFFLSDSSIITTTPNTTNPNVTENLFPKALTAATVKLQQQQLSLVS